MHLIPDSTDYAHVCIVVRFFYEKRRRVLPNSKLYWQLTVKRWITSI